MNPINKRKRLQYIIQRLEHIIESSDIDLELLLSDKDLRLIEMILNVKPYSTKDKEIKRITGRGLKYGKKKSSK